MPPIRTKKNKAARQNKTYMVSRRLGVSRVWIEQQFQLQPGMCDADIQSRADMLRYTMMDHGDVYEWFELREYLSIRQIWPALYDRWVANKDHRDGAEWAVFDKAGKIEFVRQHGFIVTDSIPYPNVYALGPEVSTTAVPADGVPPGVELYDA